MGGSSTRAADVPGQRTITFCSRSYGYCRVCYDLPVSGYRFAYRRAIPFRRLFRKSSFWESTRLFFPRVRGLVHTFNDIVINADAWMVSYELELPRFLKATKEWHLRAAFDRLADSSCRFILPMSEAARRWFLRRVPAELRDVIGAKVQVFTGGVYGPEHLGLECPDRVREPGEPLHMVFVGNDAFRKGGLFVLDAFDRLVRLGVDARLTFIGRVDSDSYALQVGPEEHTRMVNRLRSTERVTWFPAASNHEVLATLAGAHVGLLPTLDDSLGWSVIEMMACRLPVIASRTVAMPELIEDRETGRLIPVPCDEDLRWAGLSSRGAEGDVRARTHELLVNGLVESLTELCNDERKRHRMARRAREHYEARYTPEIAGRRLMDLYEEASRAGER